MHYIRPLIICSTLLLLGACKKDTATEINDDFSTRQAILQDIGSNVIAATYSDMDNRSNQLNSNILALQQSANQTNLEACRTDWRNVRAAWEQSEGFLFGPVATENIDPRIDTWPVNHIDLDSILNSTVEFTPDYVDQLQDALKGFHPIE